MASRNEWQNVYFASLDSAKRLQEELPNEDSRGTTSWQLIHIYLQIAQAGIDWRNDIETARKYLELCGKVASDFLRKRDPGDDGTCFFLSGEVCYTLLAQCCIGNFEVAKEICGLASMHSYIEETNDEHTRLYRVLGCLLRVRNSGCDDIVESFREAVRKKYVLHGHYTTAKAILDHNLSELDNGLFQIELAHKKNRRTSNPYPMCIGNVSVPMIAFHSLARYHDMESTYCLKSDLMPAELLSN